MSGLAVYAVVGEDLPGALGTGIAGEPLRLVRCGDLRIAVGERPAPPRADEEALRSWDAVVRGLAERADAILPARFGQWAADEEALAELVGRRAPELARALSRVGGCCQMTVRVFGPPGNRDLDPAPPEAASERADTAGLGPGARYLAVRRRVLRPPAPPELAPLRARLASLARGERIQAARSAGVLLATLYHLVPRPAVDEYRRAVTESVPALAPLRLVLGGPFPPYAFAEVEA